MPATYAHHRFGKMVQAALPTELQEIILAERALFSLGLHGPDLLWYDQFSHQSESANQSRALHFSSARPFFESCRARYANTPKSSAVLAYLLGFLCHFALDCTAHPYVNQLAEQGPVSHLSLESEFDKMLLRQDGKNPFETNLTPHLYPNDQEIALVANVLQTSLDAIGRAVLSMRYYNALSLSPNAEKKVRFLADLSARGVFDDYAGLLLAEKDDARCKKSNEKLWALFEQARLLAHGLLCEYAEKWQGSEPLTAAFTPNYE